MSTICKAPPQFGWIRGEFGAARVSLDFDRRQHTVVGESHGDEVRLSALRGRARALLLFYPKDKTSG